jgi:transposase
MKKTLQPKKQKRTSGLPLVHPNAAGIDIGDNFHVVAVPEGTLDF